VNNGRVGVYLMRIEGGPSKIGLSLDPENRMRQLQTGMPFKLHLVHVVWCDSLVDAVKTEQEWHLILTLWHIRGEWFDLSEAEIQDFVNQETPLIATLWADERRALGLPIC
jgi:hypothetical protein